MGPLLCPRWAPCRMLRSWFACARGLSWALACVLGSATAATAAAPNNAGEPAARRAPLLLPVGLLESSEGQGVCLLAEIGTWEGIRPAETATSRYAPLTASARLESIAGAGKLRLWKKDAWVLAGPKEWYWTSRQDCEAALLLRVFRDGGVTAATGPDIAAMSRPRRTTLRAWLGRESAAYSDAPCPELLEIGRAHV